MADNYLSRLKGQGGVSSVPFAQNRERMLQIEAQREAELVRQRMAEEAAMRSRMPQARPDQTMTIEQYLANTRGTDPRQPWVKEAPPEPSPFGYVPGFGFANLLQMLGITQAQPDVQLDDRLGRMSGNMAMNNQRLRQRLDDFERNRVRANMLLQKP